jgi:KUP system potassium uptake protein
MLGILGLIQITKHPEVFKAFNPYYAYNLLSIHPGFLFWDLYLCTTGAEALYSDMGHCGRKNIRISWILKTTLVLTIGQAAFLIHHEGETLQNIGWSKWKPILSYNG